MSQTTSSRYLPASYTAAGWNPAAHSPLKSSSGSVNQVLSTSSDLCPDWCATRDFSRHTRGACATARRFSRGACSSLRKHLLSGLSPQRGRFESAHIVSCRVGSHGTSLDVTEITQQTVESNYLFDVALGASIAPYFRLRTFPALLPIASQEGLEWLPSDPTRLDPASLSAANAGAVGFLVRCLGTTPGDDSRSSARLRTRIVGAVGVAADDRSRSRNSSDLRVIRTSHSCSLR